MFFAFYQMVQKREVLSMGSTKGMAAFGGGILFTFFRSFVKQSKAQSWKLSCLMFFLFPERLGEGRFLGAVSLSSMT